MIAALLVCPPAALGQARDRDIAAQKAEADAGGGSKERQAQVFEWLLDNLLFRAAERADVAAAKKYGDLAKRRGINFGYDTPTLLETIDRCYEAGTPVIPAAHRPTAAERAALDTELECAPFRYPIDGAPDDRKYRLCLLSQDLPENRWLAEVYANGWGVRRDAKLAIALVCHSSDVPAELVSMVKDLYESKDEEKLDEEFLFCDHAVSGMNAGVCAVRDDGIEAAKREAEWNRITATWAAPDRQAWQRVRTAADAFIDKHTDEELDQQGTALVAIRIEESASMATALLDAVKGFEAGKLPQKVSFAKADAELNAAYAAIMKRGSLDAGTITKEGIRDTQRLWLTYRDAWAAFAARRYPDLSADEWKGWLTALRTGQLKNLIEP